MFNLTQLYTTLKVLWFRLVSVSAYKGQLILKAVYGLLTSPKKQTDEFDLFALHGKQIKSVYLFFGRIYGSSICFSILSYL